MTQDTLLAGELAAAFDGKPVDIRQTDDVEIALRRVRCGCASLVLIDEQTMGASAAQMLREIRATTRGGEVLAVVLSPKSAEIERVVAFELGADDYISRSIGVRELCLRLRAVLRRHPGLREIATVFHLGPLRIDTHEQAVYCEGQRLKLTGVEYRLLAHLASHPGEVQERRQLLEQVWRWCDEPIERTAASRTVDTHVKRLREKLGAASEAIETIRGVGYRLRKAS